MTEAVVQWSSCMPSISTVRVRILLTSTQMKEVDHFKTFTINFCDNFDNYV